MADYIFDYIDSDKSKRYIYGTYIEMAFHNFYVTLQDIYKNVKKGYSKIEKTDFQDISNGDYIFDSITDKEETKILKKELNAHFPFLNILQNDFGENDKKEVIKKFWFFFKALYNDTETTNPYFADNRPFIQKWFKSLNANGKEIGIVISAQKETNSVGIEKFIRKCAVVRSGKFGFEDFIIFIHLFLESYKIDALLKENVVKSYFGYNPKSVGQLLSHYNIVPNIFNKIDSDRNRRYIYFTYVEMAFHNFFITLQHVYKCVKGVSPTIDEDDFGKAGNMFFGKHINDKPENPRLKDVFKTPEEIESVNRLLTKHFPFLKVIEEDFGGTNKIDIIEKFWDLLQVLRNTLEHNTTIKQSKFVENKGNVLKWLKSETSTGKKGIAIAAKKEMKDRFAEEININFHSVKDAPKSVNFFLNQCAKKDNSFTFKSFVVFLSLFLEGKYIYNFLNNTEIREFFYYIEKSETETRTIPFEDNDIVFLYRTLSIYNINLPAVKYDAQFDEKNILGLDIINELQKCPHELFEHLSIKDQNKFRVESGENADFPDDILLKRFQDRFASLVLRYIDTQEIFKDIRFQVSLGKYRYKFYDKQCIDSDSADRVRILQKDLKSFGRLGAMEQKRLTEWSEVMRVTDLENQAEADNAQTEPYITNQIARYNLDKDTPKIPLWWDGDCGLPVTKDDVKSGKKDLNSVATKAFLSVYDLPAVMFLHFLGGNPEKLIKDYYENFRKFFSDVKDGILTPENFSQEKFSTDYKIDFCRVPQKLQEYLTGKKRNENLERYKDLPSKMLKKVLSDQKQSFLADKQKEILDNLICRKNILNEKPAELKSGKLADYLAKSIVSLIKDNNIKPTGKNYSVLQANLAVYEIDKIEKMFVRSKIADNHPFLKKVLSEKPTNTLKFYSSYLKNEIEFFKNIENCKYLKFYKYQEEKFATKNADFYKKLAEHYLSNGYVELTGKIFESEIREKVSGKIDGVDSMDTKYNISFLINRYYQEYQPFYDYERQYKYLEPKGKIGKKDCYYASPNEINAILQKGNRISYESSIATKIIEVINLETKKTEVEKLKKIQEQFSSENIKRYRREMKNNETDISRYRIQDKILFEMAKTLLISEFKVSEMTLKNIMPKDNIFDKQMTNFCVKLTLSDKTLTVNAKGLKVKNYATIYRTIFDRRLDTLSKCIKEDTVNLDDLQKELENYDREALKINKLIYNADETKRAIPFVKGIRNSFAHWSYQFAVNEPDTSLENLRNKLKDGNLGDKIKVVRPELEMAVI